MDYEVRTKNPGERPVVQKSTDDLDAATEAFVYLTENVSAAVEVSLVAVSGLTLQRGA